MSRSLLGRYGTITFDVPFMESSIYSDCSVIHFGRWLEFVPQVYREIAERCCVEVGGRWVNRAVRMVNGEPDLRDMILELHATVVRELEFAKGPEGKSGR